MKALKQIAEAFLAIGVQSFFVGGFVRDLQLGVASDDIDVCLVGVKDKDTVLPILKKFSTKVTTEVGKKFSVWIAEIEGLGKVDFALARTEKKAGTSHTDFDVNTENVTIEQDLLRRDISINAMAINILTEKFIDPCGGVLDLKLGIAQPASIAFADDELRVIRLARFKTLLKLDVSEAFAEICRKLSPAKISLERIGGEFRKVMQKGNKPSEFFRFLQRVGWLEQVFPEIHALIGVQQSPEHHPEGDVFEHTMQCIDQAKDEFTRVVMLCHDFGKVSTTVFDEAKQKWTSEGHEEASVPIAEALLKRIAWSDASTIKRVNVLVLHHMIHTKAPLSDRVVRQTKRLLLKAKLTFEHLVEVCRCDKSGRHPLPAMTPDIRQDFAATQDVSPIVTGNMLMEIGMKPGELMGMVCDKCIEWQDRGSLNINNWKQMVLGFLKQ